ncbi:MAG: type II toxin-antitoxin system RelE/ParE family toxin [Candidatus Omnitrophica bacterium]|nr:type II toxin-antitoxin system RelE/ParE family toxin [Candidatus Omnitrophota bacterium]MDD5672141.1 type II toxin-antitoxin system RelE/ParE family toxin [Candidatus Omnitrophota bacterium]
MILSFGTKATEDLYHGRTSGREALKIPAEIWRTAWRKLDMLDAAKDLRDVASPPANRLEKLKGRYEGQYSIRINDQFRILFRFENGNALGVQIIDYH